MRYVPYHKAVPFTIFCLTILGTLICRRIESAASLELVRIGGTVLFFFWPGYFLIRLLRWRQNPISVSLPALSFAGSIALWYLASLIIFSCKSSTGMALLIALIVLYIPGLIFLFLKRDNRDEPAEQSQRWFPAVIVGILSILVICLIWEFRLEFYHLHDTKYFLTIVRKFAELDQVEVTSAQIHNGLVNQAYGLNSYLLGVGLLAKFLNQDVMLIWGTLSVSGILIFISALYLLASRLFNSVGIGCAVSSFILVYPEGAVSHLLELP